MEGMQHSTSFTPAAGWPQQRSSRIAYRGRSTPVAASVGGVASHSYASRRDILPRMRECKLVQWGLAYMAGAGAVIQGADVIGGQFNLSVLVLRSLTAVLVMGFPAALIIAWYHGQKGSQNICGRELILLATLMIGMALLLRNIHGSAQAMNFAGVGPAGLVEDDTRIFVAVLPFDEVGESRPQSMVSILHHEIIRSLAERPSLRPLSRTSVQAVLARRLTAAQMARTLQISSFLEGAILHTTDGLRVVVRLVDATTEANLWVGLKEFPNPTDAVSSEISGWVADNVRAALDRHDLSDAPAF